MPLAEDGMKLCTKCKETKPVEDFQKDRQKRDGLFTWCRTCSRSKSLAYRNANVEKAKAGVSKWKAENKDRVLSKQREYYAANPEKYRDYVRAYRARYPEKIKERSRTKHLARKFGITVEQYEALLGAQDGVCALCFGSDNGKRMLAVDHCHKTGRIRGLLCSDCNTGLGKFKDDPEHLARAIEYLLLGARSE